MRDSNKPAAPAAAGAQRAKPLVADSSPVAASAASSPPGQVAASAGTAPPSVAGEVSAAATAKPDAHQLVIGFAEWNGLTDRVGAFELRMAALESGLTAVQNSILALSQLQPQPVAAAQPAPGPPPVAPAAEQSVAQLAPADAAARGVRTFVIDLIADTPVGDRMGFVGETLATLTIGQGVPHPQFPLDAVRSDRARIRTVAPAPATPATGAVAQASSAPNPAVEAVALPPVVDAAHLPPPPAGSPAAPVSAGSPAVVMPGAARPAG